MPPVVDDPLDEGVEVVVGVLVVVGVEDCVPALDEDDPDGVELVAGVDVVFVFVLVLAVVVSGTAAPTVGTVSGGAPLVPLFDEPPLPQAAIATEAASAATMTAALARGRLFLPLPVISGGTRVLSRQRLRCSICWPQVGHVWRSRGAS